MVRVPVFLNSKSGLMDFVSLVDRFLTLCLIAEDMKSVLYGRAGDTAASLVSASSPGHIYYWPWIPSLGSTAERVSTDVTHRAYPTLFEVEWSLCLRRWSKDPCQASNAHDT